MGYFQMTRNVEELFGGVITAPHQIPFTYKSNVGGETFLSLPFYPVTGVVTINGGMQVPLDNFEIEGNMLNLGRALSKGDVVYCLFDKILSPEDTAKGIRIYKFQAVGGETEFTPDFTSYGVQSLYIGGEYKTPEIEYSYDSTTGKVSLQTALTAGVWVVAEMSVKQPNISPLFDRSIQEIARSANVKDSEVILSTDTVTVLNNKTVIYDVTDQKTYGLPTLPNNVYISSVASGQLTYNPGGVVVDLIPRPDVFINPVTLVNALRTDLSTPNSTQDVDSTNVQYKVDLPNSVSRELSSKLKDFVNIKDFGAKCDSVTDDTAAIQRAVDAMPTGGTLFFPGGNWIVVDGVINLNTGIIIQGSKTTLVKTAGVTTSEFFNANNSSITIRDMRLIGPGSTVASANTYAINTSVPADRFVAQNVIISEVWGGFRMLSTVYTIENCEVNHFKEIGVIVDQSGNTDGIGIIHNLVTSPVPESYPYAGIKLEHAVGTIISDSEIMGGNGGIVCDSPAGKFVTSLKIDNTYMDSSGAAGFVVYNNGGYAQRIVISDSWMTGSLLGNGLTIHDGAQVDGLKISNCEVNGNHSYGMAFGNNAVISNLDITDCIGTGNGVADVYLGVNVKNFNINVCRFGLASNSWSASPVGVLISAGCANFSVIGGAITNLVDNSYPSSNVLIADVRGWGYAFHTLNQIDVAAQSNHAFNVSLPEARLGDIVFVSADNAPNVAIYGNVVASGSIQVILQNNTGALVTVPTCGIRADIKRRF